MVSFPKKGENMRRRTPILFLVCVSILVLLAACKKGESPTATGSEQTDNSVSYKNTVADALTENCKDHDDEGDYRWDSMDVIHLALDGNAMTADGAGVTINGNIAIITSAGIYSINGTMTDGQIIVDTKDEEVVRLILNGVDIHCSTNPPIYITSAKKTVIILADQTMNQVSDGKSYNLVNQGVNEPNAAIFSSSDLTICGNGALSVNGNYNDGISSKDGLIIRSGTITVRSVDDGIRGKDYLIIKGGNIAVNVAGDGLKSDNDADFAKGYIYIESGGMNITSGGDAIGAVTDVLIADGEISIISGGGNTGRMYIYDSTSAKGIKAGVNTIIEEGSFGINSADDALHSNGNLAINGGSFTVASGDDGIHADSTVEINGGVITISKSYEGIEGAIITINNGDIHVTSSDDGINVSSGGGDGGMNGGPGQGGFSQSGNNYLYMNGGRIVVTAAGDGMDINGSVVMTGGTILVNGPTANDNGALDYNTFKITSGFVVAVGSSGMAQAPGGTSSTQNALLINLTASQQAGTLIHIETSDGKGILSFMPSKPFQSVAFSSSELVTGSKYNVYFGGSTTGQLSDGMYQNDAYTPGTLYTSFTVSGRVTQLGNTPFIPGGR
jgi:hypothetical protein